MKISIWDFAFFLLILLGLLVYSLRVTIQLEELEWREEAVEEAVEIHHIYLVESYEERQEETLMELMEANQ